MLYQALTWWKGDIIKITRFICLVQLDWKHLRGNKSPHFPKAIPWSWAIFPCVRPSLCTWRMPPLQGDQKPPPAWTGNPSSLTAWKFEEKNSYFKPVEIIESHWKLLQHIDILCQTVATAALLKFGGLAFCCPSTCAPARCNLSFLKDTLETHPNTGSFDLSLALH